MKPLLKALVCGVLAVSFYAVGGTVAARAQVRDARIISARAGGINFVSGDVLVQRKGQNAWNALRPQDELADGDVVSTGADGHVEVLLNPGSYLRAAADTEFTLADTSLDDLRIKLSKGSAVIEATGFGDEAPLMMVETPQGRISIVKGGVYRLNALASRVTEVSVFEGRARVGASGATLLRGSHRARFGAGGVEVAKFSRKNEKDALDLWSKERAKTLAEANRKLSRQNINALVASLQNDYFWGRTAEFGHSHLYGRWVYNSLRGCYTFIPFFPGFSSPYGYGYSNMFWGGPSNLYCRGCNVGVGNGTYDDRTRGGNGTRGGGTTPAPAPTIRQTEPSMQPSAPRGFPKSRIELPERRDNPPR